MCGCLFVLGSSSLPLIFWERILLSLTLCVFRGVCLDPDFLAFLSPLITVGTLLVIGFGWDLTLWRESPIVPLFFVGRFYRTQTAVTYRRDFDLGFEDAALFV